VKVKIRYLLIFVLLPLLVGYSLISTGLIERDPLRLEKSALSSLEDALVLAEEIQDAEDLEEAQGLGGDIADLLEEAIDDLEDAIKIGEGRAEGGTEPQAGLEVYFAYPGTERPEDDQPEDVLIDRLNGLNLGDRLDIAMHAFTDRDLRKAVKGAAGRGVVIRLYLDRIYINHEQEGAPSLEEICEAGLVIVRLENPPSSLMHHKYAVINGQTVITGSYNWSNAADTKNWETLLVIQDQEVIDAYSADFKNLWDNYSIPFCE